MPGQALHDVGLALRAILANQLAKYAPSTYLRRTDHTGRGLAAEESVQDLADYYRRCFDDYFARLGVARPEEFLAGKALLEYGPGDFPGVPLLMIAHGARRAWCVDRFPLVKLDAQKLRVLDLLLAPCTEAQRQRVRACLVDPGRPDLGFRDDRVAYRVDPSGLSGLVGEVDFAFSRAVLEHVNDLAATFQDMVTALVPGGVSLHLVDLRSHGHHRSNPLDFLRWSPLLWGWMHSAKGVPNRHRLPAYRASLQPLDVSELAFHSTHLATAAQVQEVRALVALAFRNVSDEELAWLGFWVGFRKGPPGAA